MPEVGRAQAGCLPHPSVLALHAELVQATRVQTWLLSGDDAALNQLMRDVRTQRQHARRTPAASRGFPPKTETLLDAGMIMKNGPRFRDLRAAWRALASFETAVARSCPEMAETIAQLGRSPNAFADTVAASDSAEMQDAAMNDEISSLWHGNAATRIGILAGALLTALLALLGLKRVYDVAFALIYNRRSCQIPAVLHIGASRFDGRITILGRIGCRFELIDHADRPELRSVAETDETSLRVGPFVAPAHILVLDRNTAGMHFEMPITLPQQEQMLQLSITAPQVLTRRKRLVPQIPQFSPNRLPKRVYLDERRAG